VTQAATQLLDTELALKMEKKGKAPPATAAARSPAKRFPVMPVAGGVGAVGLLAVVGWLAMGNRQKPTVPATDTLAGRAQPAAQPGPGIAQPTQSNAAQPAGSPAQSQGRPTSTRAGGPGGSVAQPPGRTAQPSAVEAAAALARALDEGINAATDGRSAEARRLLQSVFNSPVATDDQKGQAAYGLATTYPDTTDRAMAISWARQAKAMGYARADQMLRDLGVRP
jgi:hypothetical protein